LWHGFNELLLLVYLTRIFGVSNWCYVKNKMKYQFATLQLSGNEVLIIHHLPFRLNVTPAAARNIYPDDFTLCYRRSMLLNYLPNCL